MATAAATVAKVAEALGVARAASTCSDSVRTSESATSGSSRRSSVLSCASAPASSRSEVHVHVTSEGLRQRQVHIGLRRLGDAVVFELSHNSDDPAGQGLVGQLQRLADRISRKARGDDVVHNRDRLSVTTVSGVELATIEHAHTKRAEVVRAHDVVAGLENVRGSESW